MRIGCGMEEELLAAEASGSMVLIKVFRSLRREPWKVGRSILAHVPSVIELWAAQRCRVRALFSIILAKLIDKGEISSTLVPPHPSTRTHTHTHTHLSRATKAQHTAHNYIGDRQGHASASAGMLCYWSAFSGSSNWPSAGSAIRHGGSVCARALHRRGQTIRQQTPIAKNN